MILTVASAAAQIPPGYEMVRITNRLGYIHRASMNNVGQIAFHCILDPSDYNTSEIYLYDNGVLWRLTNDRVADAFPDINDAGDIVWSRKIPADGDLEIVRLRNGVLTQLTDDVYWDWGPRLNEGGEIAWSKTYDRGCAHVEGDVFLYDETGIRVVYADGSSNQGAQINDAGDVVWTSY
ncbi:MAG: hypothetical protein AB7Q17_18035 [Phycisphaerae bacterium]